MIRLSEISKSSDSEVVEFDHQGVPKRWDTAVEAPATVFVDEVTDAVRAFREGALDASLDRNQMWAVCGFRLTKEVVAKLPGDEFSADELLKSVSEAGFNWTRIRISAS